MNFQICRLDPRRLEHLWGPDDARLAAYLARRMQVDAEPGFPDRISLRDAPSGANVLLVNHEHLAVHSTMTQ